MNNYRVAFAWLTLTILFSLSLSAQQQTESVDVKIRTSSPGGNFSPKNIGAIWVEDSTGNFIKTLKLWANRRIQYLYTWNKISSGDKIDAVTSATLSSHQTHNVTWNVKNSSGEIVPNGIYKLKIEITDKHSQGPVSSFDIPIGEQTNTINFSDETYFHDIELSWTSVVTDAKQEEAIPDYFNLYQNYPNPFNPSTQITVTIPESGTHTLKVYNILGQEITTLLSDQISAGTHTLNFDASNLKSGIYFYTFSGNNFTQTKKMILVK